MANAPILFLPFGTYLKLLVLLVDLHKRTSARKHVQVKGAAACCGMSKPKVRRATVSIFSTCELRERISSAFIDFE